MKCPKCSTTKPGPLIEVRTRHENTALCYECYLDVMFPQYQLFINSAVQESKTPPT